MIGGTSGVFSPASLTLAPYVFPTPQATSVPLLFAPFHPTRSRNCAPAPSPAPAPPAAPAPAPTPALAPASAQ